VLLPAGRQILVLILGIGAVHVRRFLLGIVLQNRIVLLVLWLSSFHWYRVQLAVQATLHVRHTAHLCGLVVGFLAITIVQSQEKAESRNNVSVRFAVRFNRAIAVMSAEYSSNTQKFRLLVQKTSLKKISKIRTFREFLCRLAVFLSKHTQCSYYRSHKQ